MKKLLLCISLVIITLSTSCNEKNNNIIKIATSADYPPFEYNVDGELKGFDVEIARLIAKELGKEIVFENLQFSAILPALQSGLIDAAISTITITKERKQAFDFSDPYYNENMSVIFPKDMPITDKSQLQGKKIACQLGTTMEIWLKKYTPNCNLVVMDSNNQCIESLKAGYVDCVLADSVQSIAFCNRNSCLSCNSIAKSDEGYGIAFKKGSPLKSQVDKIIKSLKDNGDIIKLQQEWFGGAQ